MQALDLNLASRPFKNDTLLWTGFVVGLILLVVVTTWNVQAYRHHSQRRSELQVEIGDIKSKMTELERREHEARREIDRHDLRLLAVKSEKANEVIRSKAFSWTRLFNRLQDVQPWDVQMTSVHPVFRVDTKRVDRRAVGDIELVPVSVEGVAKTLQDFLELERALISDPHFDRVEPESTNTDDNSNETIFSLRFMYDPRVSEAEALEAAAEVGDELAEATAADEDLELAQATVGTEQEIDAVPAAELAQDSTGGEQEAEAEMAEGVDEEARSGEPPPGTDVAAEPAQDSAGQDREVQLGEAAVDVAEPGDLADNVGRGPAGSEAQGQPVEDDPDSVPVQEAERVPDDEQPERRRLDRRTRRPDNEGRSVAGEDR